MGRGGATLAGKRWEIKDGDGKERESCLVGKERKGAITPACPPPHPSGCSKGIGVKISPPPGWVCLKGHDGWRNLCHKYGRQRFAQPLFFLLHP